MSRIPRRSEIPLTLDGRSLGSDAGWLRGSRVPGLDDGRRNSLDASVVYHSEPVRMMPKQKSVPDCRSRERPNSIELLISELHRVSSSRSSSASTSRRSSIELTSLSLTGSSASSGGSGSGGWDACAPRRDLPVPSSKQKRLSLEGFEGTTSGTGFVDTEPDFDIYNK